jgi:hypothetical protein
MEVWPAWVAVLVSIGTLVWTWRDDRQQRRRDILLNSLAKMISNSKKLTHEDRKGFVKLGESVDRGPLSDIDMRRASDEYRHEVGIEYVVLDAFGNQAVQTAALNLYEQHKLVRRAIWHTHCAREHVCEDSRRAAWETVAEWGADTPSENLFPVFKPLVKELVDAVREDSRIAKTRPNPRS